MLIVFAGLSGTGKTTSSRDLARRLSATYLRIDTVEQAAMRAVPGSTPGVAGYVIALSIAADNLLLGSTVVADSVNPLSITRDSWMEVAEVTGVPLLEVEILCSDLAEHRRRVETRAADIPGQRVPTWDEIADRVYEPWSRERIVVDTAGRSEQQSLDEILEKMAALMLVPAGA